MSDKNFNDDLDAIAKLAEENAQLAKDIEALKAKHAEPIFEKTPLIEIPLTIAIYTDKFNDEDDNECILSNLNRAFEYKHPPKTIFIDEMNIEKIREIHPDILVVDYGGLESYGASGLSSMVSSALHEIMENCPDLFVLFTTVYSVHEYEDYMYCELDKEFDPKSPNCSIMGATWNLKDNEWKHKVKVWINP